MSAENVYIQQQLPFSTKEQRTINKASFRSPIAVISDETIFSTEHGAIYTHEGSSIVSNLLRRALIKNDNVMSSELRIYEKKQFVKNSKKLGFSSEENVWDDINFLFRQVTMQRAQKDNRVFSLDINDEPKMTQLPLVSHEIVKFPRLDQLLVADK